MGDTALLAKIPPALIRLLLVLALVVSLPVNAADVEFVEKTTGITRAATAPILDGVLNEAEWDSAVVVSDIHQMKPVEYAAPTEATEFLLLYTESALYIGVRAYDSQPDEIRAKVLRQGGILRSDDRIRIVLDPFNDKRSGYGFIINPNGVRLDGIFKDTNFDLDWDGIWDGRSQITTDGWTSEILIPFKTLSFSDSGAWGLNMQRVIPRLNEEVAWSSRNQSIDPAVAGTLVGMRDISQGIGLDIVPSVSAMAHRDYDAESTESDAEPSLDLYYKLTTGMNASLTLNTDFSATEVDSRQVNLTRFGLFFPEKRSFFLRESDIFEFGGIGGNVRDSTFFRSDSENGRPFFSRRIGLSSTGQPVDIDYGGKVSGRIGNWNLGAMAIRQDEFEAVDPATIVVGRATVNVLEESNLGVIFTDGDPRSNLDNSLIGIDYQYRNSRLSDGRRLDASFWYQQSDTEGIDGDDAAWGLEVASPNSIGWRGGFGAREIQQGFMPAVGFISRANVHQYSAEVGYTTQKNGSLVRTYYNGIDAQRFDVIDGELESQRILFRLLEIATDSDDKINFRYEDQRENLVEPFEISEGVIIPVGDYSFGAAILELATSQNRVFDVGLNYSDGDFFDGSIQSWGGSIGWRPTKHFGLSASYSLDDVELPQGNFTTRLASAEIDIVFTNTISWVNLVQYDNVSDSIGINSRVHWVPQAGRNFYFVVNHNYRERVSDQSFHSISTDVTLKFDYTFRF